MPGTTPNQERRGAAAVAAFARIGQVWRRVFAERQLLLRSGGRVIFTSSLGARTALPDYAVYAISKSAVEKLTVILAKDFGPSNITVNCVSPGLIASDANADIRANDEIRTYLERTTPLRRLGVPSDLSGVVTSLVSEKMGYVTGQIIEVTGGMSL